MNRSIKNGFTAQAMKWGALLGFFCCMGIAQAQTCGLGANGAPSGGSFALQSYPSTVGVNVSASSTFGSGTGFTLQNVQGVARSFASTNYIRVNGNTSITYTFSPAVPANRVALVVFDVGVATTISPAYSPALTLSVTGGASPGDFGFSSMLDSTGAPTNPLTYTPATGVLSKTSSVSTVRESGAVVGNSANLVSSLTLTTARLDGLDMVGYALLSIPTCITTRKTSVGGTGSFSFANTNLSASSTVLTTTAVNAPVDSAASFVPDPTGAVAINETVPASPPGWRLASASCTDANSAITGNTGTFGVRSGNGVTIPSARLSSAANITCTMTNSLLVAANDIQSTWMDVPVSSTTSIFTNDTGTGIALSALNGAVCASFPCSRGVAGGAITVDSDGNYTFSPTAGFTGIVSIPYEITDAAGMTAMANIVITVNPVPKLSLAKSSNGPWVVQQSGAIYSLSVSNNGTVGTSGALTVRDRLPAGVSANSGTYGGWDCSVSGQDVSCTSSTPISMGATSTIPLPVAVSAGAVPGVTNMASVGGGGDPFNGGNPPEPGSCAAGDAHCAAVTTAVSSEAPLNITKTNGVAAVAPGNIVTYTVMISNPGATPVSGLSWSDQAASGLSDLVMSDKAGDGKGSDPGLCTGLVCTGITVVAGGSVTYTVTAKVTGAMGSTAQNSAVLVGGHCTTDAPCISTDSDPIEAANATPVPVGTPPILAILALALLLVSGLKLRAGRAQPA